MQERGGMQSGLLDRRMKTLVLWGDMGFGTDVKLSRKNAEAYRVFGLWNCTPAQVAHPAAFSH